MAAIDPVMDTAVAMGTPEGVQFVRAEGRRPGVPRRRRFLVTVARHSVLIAFAAMFALPFVYMLLQSVMPIDQVKTGEIWPRSFEWSNYKTVFDKIPLLTYFKNTALVCIATTVGTVVSCVPVAFVFSRVQWRGRTTVFVIVLATMMLPYQVLFVPQYQIFSNLGWVDSLLPLTVPAFFADAFSIFLLRQFFLTLPGEVLDAARVDGAGEFRVLTRVVVPLARPAIMAVAMFQFLFSWGDFFGPLLYLNTPDHYTLAVGIQQFNSEVGRLGASNLTLAASAMFITPVIILFFFAQKVFIEGVALTGIKG